MIAMKNISPFIIIKEVGVVIKNTHFTIRKIGWLIRNSVNQPFVFSSYLCSVISRLGD